MPDGVAGGDATGLAGPPQAHQPVAPERATAHKPGAAAETVDAAARAAP